MRPQPCLGLAMGRGRHVSSFGPWGHSWRLCRDAGPRIGRKEARCRLGRWWSLPVQQSTEFLPPCARLLPVHCAVHEDSTGEDGEAESSPMSCSSLTASSDQSGSLSPAPCALGQSSQAALMLVASWKSIWLVASETGS